MPRAQRFTVYDAMEAKGLFEANPANQSSSEYKRQDFPKMLYSPTGEMKVIVPAELITTPLGPKFVGEQRELISKIAADAEEEAKLLSEGWHLHPARAIAAGGGVAPLMSSDQRIQELEAQIAKQQLELGEARANLLADTRASGQSTKSAKAAA